MTRILVNLLSKSSFLFFFSFLFNTEKMKNDFSIFFYLVFLNAPGLICMFKKKKSKRTKWDAKGYFFHFIYIFFISFQVVRYVSGIALNPEAYRWVILFVMEHESRSSSWVWVGGLQISHKFYGPFNFLLKRIGPGGKQN